MVSENLLSGRVAVWSSSGTSLLYSKMGSVLEDAQGQVFHHCHFPTGTRKDPKSLHDDFHYGSISVFEHGANLPNRLSSVQATKDSLHAAWASLLCNYTRNETVAFVTNTGNQKTSHMKYLTNGTSSVERANAWMLEYQTLSESDPQEIHRVSLESCSPRALRDAQVNTAIDSPGALRINNGEDTGGPLQLLVDQHHDIAEIVSPLSIELKRGFVRMHCNCRSALYASAFIFYLVELRTKAECMKYEKSLRDGKGHVLPADERTRLNAHFSHPPNSLLISLGL